jgi:hypothetical protein
MQLKAGLRSIPVRARWGLDVHQRCATNDDLREPSLHALLTIAEEGRRSSAGSAGAGRARDKDEDGDMNEGADEEEDEDGDEDKDKEQNNLRLRSGMRLHHLAHQWPLTSTDGDMNEGFWTA